MQADPTREMSACRGKHPFASARQAIAVSDRPRRAGHTLKAYHCRHCGAWHLGTATDGGRRLMLEIKRRRSNAKLSEGAE